MEKQWLTISFVFCYSQIWRKPFYWILPLWMESLAVASKSSYFPLFSFTAAWGVLHHVSFPIIKGKYWEHQCVGVFRGIFTSCVQEQNGRICRGGSWSAQQTTKRKGGAGLDFNKPAIESWKEKQRQEISPLHQPYWSYSQPAPSRLQYPEQYLLFVILTQTEKLPSQSLSSSVEQQLPTT